MRKSNKEVTSYNQLYVLVFDWKFQPFVKIGITGVPDFKRIKHLQYYFDAPVNVNESIVIECNHASTVSDVEAHLKFELEDYLLEYIKGTNRTKENTTGFSEMYYYQYYDKIIHLAKTYFEQFEKPFRIIEGKEFETKLNKSSKS